MKYLHSDKPLKDTIPNIAMMLKRNAALFNNQYAYQEKIGVNYKPISWTGLYEDILNISFNLKKYGFSEGEKVVVFSPNRLEMLEMELAIMASGGISVPIFAYFNKSTASKLIRHSEANFLVVAGSQQLSSVDENTQFKQIFSFESIVDARFKKIIPFLNLVIERPKKQETLDFNASPEEVCLDMYTSGTMGVPKAVQLTHRNILSQQAALADIWNIDKDDRFLSYLPWHHSFGGIFERFSAIYNGACLSLDSGYGKDASILLENWKIIKPTVFFSVPKVYQSLIEAAKADQKAEDLLYNSGLKFAFTAAAPLPKKIQDEFDRHNIPVMEGWGLTETSPCCTLTDPSLEREPGVVGKPIPGVSLRIADDGEIQVLGPNVMKGYYHNDEANDKAFTDDGWFCTGDIGEITENGLKLIARKDRVFKLVNGEKVIPSDIEILLQSKCHYIMYAIVVGSGKEYPVALLFPNKKQLESPIYVISPEEGCFCPRSLEEFSRCIRGCLNDANNCIGEKFSRIKAAMLVNDELSIEKNTLTPSLKITPNNIISAYKAHLEYLYGEKNEIDDEVYVIQIEENTPKLLVHV